LNHPKGAAFQRLDLRTNLSDHHHCYDIITALDVLEHLEDDVQGLKDIALFARPHGQIVVTVPSYQWLWGEHDVISHHKRRYTATHLRRIADQTGLDVLFLSYFNLCILPFSTALVWVKKFMKNVLPQSNFLCSPAGMNQFFYQLTSIEARKVGNQRWRLPMGTSLIARFRKK
jgi:hypothetical protein